MFYLDQCPACGKLHDDGWLFYLDNRRVFLCMECTDNAPKDKVERREWLKQKLGSYKKTFAFLVQRW